MEAVMILIVIFVFIIVITSIDESFKMKRRKMDAALKMREMEGGYAPGTYSAYNYKRRRRHSKVEGFTPMEETNRESQRELLKKGIDDLQQRLDNIEIIMQSRKAHEKE
ncbi:hypothetical protein [Sphaerochaeta sp. PS]|uniref:hypothetical protein n=1 Tax=Sphaerochaeta sp. PS TaxID=3076336 RepID=UPI0028A3C335|nr:hypothetical protein [Sphaerochaeta sp. PS]MDT4762617.1 hypothetical protein [Sphaerochaeta sp. PS]